MDLERIDELWFSEAQEMGAEKVPDILAVFEQLHQAERGDEAEAWAKQLFQKFAEEDDFDAALLLLEWLAVARNAVEDPKASVKRLLSKNRTALKMVEPAGFGKKSLKESFRRLRFLRSLKEGLLCYNPTWGAGTIEEIDAFYQQIEVNFKKKGEHEMSFSYAAEALEILDDEHLLSLSHRQPDEVKRLIKEDPAEIVRIALKSYGSMPITRLQETLCPTVIPESGWKKFWAAARAALKNDPLVEIPKKRSENIFLRETALAYDDDWFGQIKKERDIETLFKRFKEILEKKIDFTSPAAQDALANRLLFIIKGAPSARSEWKAEGFIYARLFDIEPSGIETQKLIHELIEGDLVTTLDRLPTRQLQTLLSILIENDKEAVIATLSRIIPTVSYPVLSEIMTALMANGEEEAVRQIMGTALARRTASAPMLLWCQRSPELVIDTWKLATQGELAFRIQEVMEAHHMGAMLRAENQLRERFQQEDWLHDVMGHMTPQQRRDFLRRINEGQGWDLLDRKSVIAKVLRKFPELQDIILPSKGQTAPKKQIPFTSTHSYEAKQKQLEQIMKVDIPENSKEIELARSYGDLRENAEFKYAKERQGLLMAQGAQLADDLERVKPSDFSDVDLSVASMGSGVKLRYPDGTEEVYYILGVWDQDESLSIISSETRLAQAILEKKEGDSIETPDGKTCTLEKILPLSDEVRTWING